MKNSMVYKIKKFGQSVWYDNIRRGLIVSGELKRMVDEDGICGITSNPTIFEKAITGNQDYDEEIIQLSKENRNAEDIYNILTVEDISMAADLLSEVYQNTGMDDGYVSIEVSPKYAYNTNAAIIEARRIRKEIDKPNIMIKVPATKEGIPAIEQLISEGININVTLIFSMKQYENVARAYINGLGKLSENGGDLSGIRSVASVFISRIDTYVDRLLEDKISKEKDESGKEELAGLKGKTAVAYVKQVYQLSKQIFAGEDFMTLKVKGASTQRPLWASTGVKNPGYRDTMYIEELIGPGTVNTVPNATLEAFRDHGMPGLNLEKDLDKSTKVLESIRDTGIDMNNVCEILQKEGVESFAESFENLIKAIRRKGEK
ncbi:MAG: transaldolase [Elusimicrobiota bacterium]